MIRIIGIGSPFGDDAAGLEAARTLAAAPPPECEIIAADRPGASLVEMLDGADAAILIDAARTGAPPGTIHEFGFDELERAAAARLVSSHGVGVAAAVALARKLGRAPAHGRIVAIEIAPAPQGAPCELSAAAREAAERASIRARQLAAEMNGRARERLLVSGVVQGVGFRPFVWRLARSLELAGFVRNSAGGVEIEVEGRRGRLREFRRRLSADAPSAAAIERIESDPRKVLSEKEFSAMPSERGRAATTIPPDLATCPDCLREILDPADRRYRYPFTNCTACGPRFTVVRALPYDRETTTMRGFALCARCEREYLDPSDRRFRAEPVACPRCGPRAWLEECRPRIEGASAPAGSNDCIGAAAAILRDGGTLAVQGVGGFHLACDAGNEAAVLRLRTIKRRAHKPLAVMIDSLEAARRLARVSGEEAALLASPAAPIVLMRKHEDATLAPSIAPGNDHVGVMLAYTPLHHLLIRDAGRALVMTSANLPGEPLARTVEEARAAFGDRVDAILAHNRPIHQRCDDSVWMAAPGGAQPIRVSRGATPRAIAVPVEAPAAVLGAGGDIKNGFCILAARQAMMSQYIGTLGNVATQEHFRESLEKWCALTGVRPAAAAHDLHPQSVARELAASLGIEMVGVQHHHAHIAACLAEHGRCGPAIGIVLDGTGYGVDGAIWGGEAMVADLRGFERLSHLEYLPLAGGDAAIRHPARIAASYLLALFGAIVDERLRMRLGEEHARVLARMVERGINTVATSSCGRMFDAVAALLGVRDEITYEAQAAIELETLARAAPPAARIYPFAIEDGAVRLREMFAAIVEDLRRATPTAQIARAFHDTVAEMVAQMAARARAASGIDVVALSGGCFQNRLLIAGSLARLRRAGFTVLTHRKVPANDGGLALGQATIAAARLSEGQVREVRSRSA